MSEIPGPTSHIYYSQRLRLHYVDWGNPEAPPLLLVHGGRDHCRNWDWLAQRLRDDYHVIAPDLRGHGDSQWMLGGSYTLPEFVCDIAQLVDQLDLTPVTILAHSLGGMISVQYAGIYPDNVKKLIAIEGLGPSPRMIDEHEGKSVSERMANWIDFLRKLSARLPRRYATLEEAVERMQGANPHLSPAQARHLTIHGVSRNEDGTYCWKFDNYVRAFPPYGMTITETQELWTRIICPMLLVYGSESSASDPLKDGRADHFTTAQFHTIKGAGHWVHHDRLDEFLALSTEFLKD